MTLATELDLPVFDHTDEELRGERFHEVMTRLAGEGWLASSPLGWMFVLDHEAATFFLRTRGTEFPSKTVAAAFGVSAGPLAEAIAKNLISVEGVDHRRLRNLVNPAFNVREADALRPVMREHLAELWEPLAAKGSCEFVADFAKHYPSRMIATVVGAPLEDAPRLHGWAMWFQKQFDPAALMSSRDEIEAAVVEFDDYARDLIDERRTDPREDLISKLLTATHEGDRLSDDECLNLIMNVIAGGIDTTQAQLAHGVRLFAERPEQWALLQGDPELVPRAVEEIVRFEPITPFTARMTVEDVEHRGVTIPANTVLMISTFAANHDGAQATEPDSFDITAEREGFKVMTFGAGIHNCLGMALARAELQEAFAFLAPRMHDLELDGEPAYDSVAGVYGLDALPLRFRAVEPG